MKKTIIIIVLVGILLAMTFCIGWSIQENLATPVTTVTPATTATPEDDAWSVYVENYIRKLNNNDVEAYWTEVHYRLSRKKFLTTEEENYLLKQGFTENGAYVWLGDDGQMHYPVIFKDETSVCVVFVNDEGHLITAREDGSCSYWPQQVHSREDGFLWISENVSEEENRKRADVVYSGPDVGIVYDGNNKELSVWWMGERYATYTVPDTVELEYVPQDTKAEQLTETSLIFRDVENGNLWTFEKFDSAEEYLNYPGGNWIEE